MALIGPTPRDTDVLVVCTANVCRSPYAAALLRRHLPRLSVAAAGTAPTRGVPLDPRIAPLLSSWGAPVRGVAGHRLTRRSLRRARLILTATGSHRQRVGELDPAAAERTFTLKEFARLLGLPGGAGPGGTGDLTTGTALDTALDPALDLALDPALDPALVALNAAVEAARSRRRREDPPSGEHQRGRPPGTNPSAAADPDDLADPYGGDTAAYRRMFAEVDAAVAVIVAALTPPGAPGP